MITFHFFFLHHTACTTTLKRVLYVPTWKTEIIFLDSVFYSCYSVYIVKCTESLTLSRTFFFFFLMAVHGKINLQNQTQNRVTLKQPQPCNATCAGYILLRSVILVKPTSSKVWVVTTHFGNHTVTSILIQVDTQKLKRGITVLVVH